MSINKIENKASSGQAGYEDVDGLTSKKLNFGLWYVEHISMFRRFIVVSLIIIGTLCWAYSIYGFGYYFIKGMQEDEILTRAILNSGLINQNFIESTKVRSIETGQIHIFKIDEKKFDFAVKILNPNEKRWAKFEYYFQAGDKILERKKGFILPAETKYLLSLAQDFDYYPQTAELRIENISWHKIDAHAINDWEGFKQAHLNIAITDVVSSRNQEGLSEKININNLNFSASNNTAFNYLNMNFIILFFSSPDNLVGVYQYNLPEFRAGKKEDVRITWAGDMPSVGEVAVIPEADMMDKNIYLSY